MTSPIRSLLVAGAALLSPMLAHSAAIDVNGVCDFNCVVGPSMITPGQTVTQSFNFDVTVNGDLYNISGNIFNSYTNGTFLGFYPTVTYIGVGPSKATDTITLDMLEDFADPQLTNPNWSGTYNEKIPLVLPVAGSSATGQVEYDGQTVGVLGPVFGTGIYNLTQTTPLANLNGNPLDTDYKLSFTFPTGTAPNGFGSSPAPEPAETMLLGLGSVALLLLKGRKFLARKN